MYGDPHPPVCELSFRSQVLGCRSQVVSTCDLKPKQVSCIKGEVNLPYAFGTPAVHIDLEIRHHKKMVLKIFLSLKERPVATRYARGGY
jgi:hypothetical protein